MKIAGSPTPVRDLTRWNRAGLTRFAYVEGGGAEWLEDLRVAHLLLFGAPATPLPSDDPDDWVAAFATGDLGGLPLDQALGRLASRWRQPPPQSFVAGGADYPAALRAQYDHIPLDAAQQISRAFARGLHILTETLNAYANEGYLRTATQPPLLHRLLEMIGFRPSMPASAQLPVALLMKPDALRQVIARGLAAEYPAQDGSAILTFETTEDLAVDPALNSLRPAGWNARSDPIPATETLFRLNNSSTLNNALTGSIGLFEQDGRLEAFEIRETDRTAATMRIARGRTAIDATFQQVQLSLAPKLNLSPRPVGSYWLNFAAPTTCYVGQRLSLSTQPLATIAAHAVTSSSATLTTRMLALNFGTGETSVSPHNPAIGIIKLANGGYGIALGNFVTVMEVRGRDIRISDPKPNNVVQVLPALRSTLIKDDPDDATAPKRVELGEYTTPTDAEPVGTLVNLSATQLHFEGKPDPALQGAVGLRLRNGGIAAARVQAVQPEDEAGYAVTLTLPSGVTIGEITQLAAHFPASSGLLHEVRSPADLLVNGSLDLAVTAGADLLRAGRRLLLVSEAEDPPKAATLTIARITAQGTGIQRLTFAEPLANLPPFRRGYTVVHANVAPFGHGKSQPQTVLGSGDAAQQNQVIALPLAPVSTRPDAGFPGGVAADLEITVAGRLLRQVASAADADPDQPSYLVRLTEDNHPEVVFLMRNPTGTDNLHLTRFRIGAGETGNGVPAGAITKPTPAHPAIAALVQPLPPRYGADGEGVDALRAKGDSQFALLDRALSIDDFARLAESHAAIWHASGSLRREAGAQGQPTIVLTLVPAAGGPVAAIRETLMRYLLDRALPGTRLRLQDFTSAKFGGRATVTLKRGYPQSPEIAEEIRTLLLHRFGLETRQLGQTLFTAEIVAAIESHPTVDHLVFALVPQFAAGTARVVPSVSGAIEAVVPNAQTLVHLAGAGSIDILWSDGGPG